MAGRNEVYERALAAKKAVEEQAESRAKTINNEHANLDFVRFLHDFVKTFSYDERCVIAAGAFQRWRGQIEFSMPATETVIREMNKRDQIGDNDFVAVTLRWTERGENGYKECHRVGAYSGKQKEGEKNA